MVIGEAIGDLCWPRRVQRHLQPNPLRPTLPLPALRRVTVNCTAHFCNPHASSPMLHRIVRGWLRKSAALILVQGVQNLAVGFSQFSKGVSFDHLCFGHYKIDPRRDHNKGRAHHHAPHTPSPAVHVDAAAPLPPPLHTLLKSTPHRLFARRLHGTSHEIDPLPYLLEGQGRALADGDN